MTRHHLHIASRALGMLLLVLALELPWAAGAQKLEFVSQQEATKAVAADSNINTKIGYPRVRIGFRLGGNITSLSFSNEAINDYSRRHPLSAVVGIYAQIQLGSLNWALRPELTLCRRGDSLMLDDIGYSLRSKYFDLRLPLIYRLPVGKTVAPYLLVAPHIDLARGGKLAYSDMYVPNGISLPITAANLRGVDLGIMLGGGIELTLNRERFPIYLSLEAAYNFGLANTFSAKEMQQAANQATITNGYLGTQLWSGSRYNRGLEVALHVAVPIDGRRYSPTQADAKQAAETKPILTPVDHSATGRVDTVYIHDTLYVVHQQTIVDQSTSASAGTNPMQRYRTKQNLSMDDLLEYLDEGTDISNMRISLNNINFSFDSYALTFDAAEMLLDLVRIMRDYPDMTIEVYGHTDSRGTDDYNKRLSESRANAVASYLHAYGIRPWRIKVYGLGKRFPLTAEYTEADRARNRRVEIEITNMGRRRSN